MDRRVSEYQTTLNATVYFPSVYTGKPACERIKRHLVVLLFLQELSNGVCIKACNRSK